MIPPHANTEEETRRAPIVEMRQVVKHYGHTRVLNGVDLQVNLGQVVVLIGPSGCGKSTLLRCMNGLDRVDGGFIKINGQDLNSAALNLSAFRAQVGTVFQQFNLFPHMTVLDNVTLAPVRVLGQAKAQAVQTAKELLQQVGLGDRLNAYPEQLSGGQQQRVAIVRSLAMNPPLMLLDEPTSALDPVMTKEVLSVIRSVAARGVTLVVVTHEWQFAESVADTVVLMMDGQVVEQGPPAQVLQNPTQPKAREFLECLHL
ncbi:MAG: amino acid ABC transporter ATP-binding protein [Candidatus Melainabacteria bacterium]|nr:amino acid ABC transporter ATP-binding protein [Candidatus Melainabacteria bacterium]